MKELELLAPAGSLKTLKAVIHAGADAVYLGGSMFGARAYANNFNEEELLEAIRLGHIHGRKIILAVNTLLKEYELGQLYDYLHPYYEAGLDAVIVQDMGVMEFIKTHFPNLPIHTSTQMTITNVEGARLLKEQGVERVVTAREMSLEEIQRIHDEVGVELESFIHGALCYCYSGQCLFSSIIGGRSGNRGRCAQPCRLSYEVLQGEKSLTGHHATPILSLKDMCTLPFLYELADHGVYSFKIEGRMKTPEYAAGVVSIYRKYMDSYLDGSRIPVEKKDIRALLELGNRGGFTNGYYYHHNDSDMLSGESASHNKSEGVLQDNIRREYVDTELKEKIKGKLILNKECPAKIEVQYGKIKVSYQGDMVLVAQNRPLTEEVVTEKITKTGNTPFVFENLEVTMDDDIFMPVNQLNQLRRGALEALEEALLKPYERTLPELVETSSAETDRQTTGNAIKEKQISGQSLSQTSGQQSAGSSTEVRVLIEDAEQLPAVLKADFVDTVYLDCMLYTRENLIRKLSEDIDRVQASGRKAYIDNFPCLNQLPELPTGCEVTSLTMVLNYLGYDADKTDIAANYLEKGDYPDANPNTTFVGTPFDKASYGCFAPVITDCANLYGAHAVNISGASIDQFCQYVENGQPVIVWATMNMESTDYGSSVWIAKDGQLVIWPGMEHCLVMIGFDSAKNEVYMADPLNENITTYNFSVFYQRWLELGCQGVIVDR